jgi:hypothetical protein
MSELYHIKAILLMNCPYSEAASELINLYKIPNKTTWVNQNNKENFKTELINTFPQIYLNKYNTNNNLLLGGYDDLKSFIDIFKNKPLSDNDINKFMMKYKWSKKATLRFIQLINQK